MVVGGFRDDGVGPSADAEAHSLARALHPCYSREHNQYLQLDLGEARHVMPLWDKGCARMAGSLRRDGSTAWGRPTRMSKDDA